MRLRARVAALVVIMASGSTASAEVDAGVCSAEQEHALRLQRSLDACLTEVRGLGERTTACQAEREVAVRRGGELAAKLQASQDSNARICSATGALATALASEGGPIELPTIGECVSSAQHEALEQMVEGRGTTASLLNDLTAYLSGATDVPPQPRAGNGTRLRAIADRLAGSGKGPPSLVLRRVLVEAIERVAPRFWRRLAAAGRDAIERWLSSAAPLDEAIVSEAHAAVVGSGSFATASLASALRLVASYEELAGCDRHAGARECGRARELRQLLERSGPLVVRQRVHEIWATPCGSLGKEAVLAWMRDLPAARAELGKSEWREIESAGRDKMFSCFLASESALTLGAIGGPKTFAAWMSDRLPEPAGLTSRSLERIDELRGASNDARSEELCARALGTVARLDGQGQCELAPRQVRVLLDWFSAESPAEAGAGSFERQLCARVVTALWNGRRPLVASAVNRVPSPDDLVSVVPNAIGGASTLRTACDQRVGDSFSEHLPPLARVAAASGEDVSHAPWHADRRSLAPVEDVRFRSAATTSGWLRHLAGQTTACRSLGLEEVRCRTCVGSVRGDAYDCRALARLRSDWGARSDRFRQGGAALALFLVLVGWARRLGRAARTFDAWRGQVRASLCGIGLAPRRDWLRFLLPSRFAALTLDLPPGAEWQRWGHVARIVKAVSSGRLGERDVQRAAALARAVGAEVALLLHDEGAAPELKAVRALLEWAAKGPRGGVQILPLATERLRAARTADELLDIIEQTSLRGNPFDVRGRLVSSSQFFNRERLVSGLLAAAQAGHWVMITGLRRFGKSSLALEVARRLPGPSAYVDLAGFHHEFASGPDQAAATEALLRYTLLQLHESARTRYPSATELPSPPGSSDPLNSGALLAWLRKFVGACRAADGGRAPSFLVIFDEVEQALGVGPHRMAHALDVLSVLIGRLRACLVESLAPSGCRFGVAFCGAVHPLLWAPIATLGRQSLVGAFQSVFVPRLPDDAAYAMMRGLGARQGIRFTEAALEVIVRETGAIPILARRVGSSVLELYDPERARQGGLGAVEIGVEGASAAVEREEEPGSPLRVWVESEIADHQSPVGTILRRAAAAGRVATDELRQLAVTETRHHLATSGIAALLGTEELDQRSQEAAGFIIRMLVEIGLLVPEGDPSSPDALSFPDSIVRRILASELGSSGFGF
jgi:hypothetical protein